MVATGYANPNVKAVDLRTTLRVALRAHSLSNNRPERNENCVTYVPGLKCYPCWRLQKPRLPAGGLSPRVNLSVEPTPHPSGLAADASPALSHKGRGRNNGRM